MTASEKKKVEREIKLLTDLADLMKKVRPDRFDMSSWASGPDCDMLSKVKDKPNECGTTACAMGWATTLQSFKRMGVKLVKRHSAFRDNENCDLVLEDKSGSQFEGQAVPETLFEHLPLTLIERLFYDSTEDPKEKAKQIKEAAKFLSHKLKKEEKK